MNLNRITLKKSKSLFHKERFAPITLYLKTTLGAKGANRSRVTLSKERKYESADIVYDISFYVSKVSFLLLYSIHQQNDGFLQLNIKHNFLPYSVLYNVLYCTIWAVKLQFTQN